MQQDDEKYGYCTSVFKSRNSNLHTGMVSHCFIFSEVSQMEYLNCFSQKIPSNFLQMLRMMD